MQAGLTMKSREEISANTAGRVIGGNCASPDISTSVSDFLEQERLCKELYLSLGVQSQDVAGSSDDDVASILEQMSRLQPEGEPTVVSSDRNIEDILREAESLLDCGNVNVTSETLLVGPCSQIPLSEIEGVAVKCSSEPVGSANRIVENSVNRSEKSKLMNGSDSFRTESEPRQQHRVPCDLSPEIPVEDTPGHDMNNTYLIHSDVIGTPLQDSYRRIHEEIRSEVEGSLAPHIAGDFPNYKLSLPVPGIDTPSTEIPGCFNLEQEFLQERKRCLKLKADLDWLRSQHEREIKELHVRHEQQLLQIREELRLKTDKEPSVVVLEKDLAAQEKVIVGYQQENEKLLVELKNIKESLKQGGPGDETKKVEAELRAELEKERSAAKKSSARIQDLERQVRELEGIVRRRQQQVSSVLPCADAPTSAREAELQGRVNRLEKDLEERQQGVTLVQGQLNTVKAKYEELVATLEHQLNAAQNEVAELKQTLDRQPKSARQTEEESQQQPASPRKETKRETGGPVRRLRRSRSVGGSPGERQSGAGTSMAVMPHQQNRPVQPARPDVHLIATIRGLQRDLNTKERELVRLRRELSDARSRAKLPVAPLAPSAPVDPDLEAENRGLRRDVARLQGDLLSLHAKRVSDLTRLQAKHEEEVERVVCERVADRVSDRTCDARVAELQGQLYTQQLVIAHLKEQIKQTDHLQEELAVLRRERDLLERTSVDLNKELSRLKEAATPDALKYAALQEKVEQLQARHDIRERKLQGIIQDLVREESRTGQASVSGEESGAQSTCSAASCPASVRLLHKNRDLCYYRSEMDRLVAALSDLQRSRKNSPC